jgi:trigger factor
VFGELMPSAAVPGFRAGRAPRKLVEHRFKKEVSDQVKGSLLMDSLEQLNEEQKLSAISEPDIDMQSVEIPDDGPLTFEFDLEVRPEFDVPQWKGLKIERPVRDFSDKDVDAQMQRVLSRKGRLTPFDGAAKEGDYLIANLTFKHGDDVLGEAKEEMIAVRPTLSFRDGKLEDFDKLMKGVKAGETREGEVKLTDDAPNEALRGKKVKVAIEVLEVKKLQLPELTPEFLEEIGDFKSEDELREALRKDLERQLHYHQQQRARQQITALLTAAANWELPPDLLRRQGQRELSRSVMELRRSGFSDEQIRAHENELRQNSLSSTARSLKEHFILERIAEEEKIADEPEDYEAEIGLIAAQSGESPRRVRAQIEKRDLMDILRNQIIERKVIEKVLSQATFKEITFKPDSSDIEAIDRAAGGDPSGADIPEAKNAGEAQTLPKSVEHD